MNFGQVLAALKKNPNRRFARKGWNGKGMFIYLTPGRIAEDIPDWRGPEDCLIDGDLHINSHIDMRLANGTMLCGWLASQLDMLAEDWYEVL